MPRTRSALLPIMRSETQARMLARLLLRPGEASVADIAAETAVDPGNVSREADRLVAAGLIAERRVGRTRLLRADPSSPLTGALTELLAVAYGPKPILEERLSGLEGVLEAWIYGSWAARWTGRAGPPPRDVDVLVIGTPDRDSLHDRTEGAARELGLDVQAVVRRPGEWAKALAADAGPNEAAEAVDPFLLTVARSPRTRLDLASSPGERG